MNKATAEIIAGLIPQRMARNRWRGRLRYGFFKSLQLRKKLRKVCDEPQYNLAICSIAKDEGPYIAEWIEWHISVGVEKFFFYDNGSTDNTRAVLEPYINKGIVEYVFFPGYRKQIAAYDDCIERHRFDTRWLAFIDLDEFIVPVKHATVTEFLQDMDCAGVEINWLTYGSSGQVEKSDSPVMKRFTKHSFFEHPINRHVKSIIDPRRVYCMSGCHEASRLSGVIVDSHGNAVTENFKRREPQHDIIRINHYAVKSRQEFLEKQARGRASGKQRTVPDDYFARYDLNDVEEHRSDND